VLETVLSMLRRFLSGQPLFAADRQHIHHKLLERGFSQQQVVWILYVVSAACGLLSLFLLYPSGPTVGVVLFVIGVGIWVGVQHLGYQEFIELGRVASRTIEQKRIIVNNLSIRRATRALSKAQRFEDIRDVLQDAFKKNDFDGYQLQLDPSARTRSISTLPEPSQPIPPKIGWNKHSTGALNEARGAEWKLTLELATKSKRKLGSLLLHRQYSDRPLLIDINLLFSGFNVALADACERAATHAESSIEIAESNLIPGPIAAEKSADVGLTL
jgi:hypothetical protein